MILANVALPTFFGHGIFLLLGLLPIALIEGMVLRQRIQSVQWKRAFTLALRANLKSTIVGIPFAWFSSLLLSIPFTYLVGQANTDWGEKWSIVLGHAFLSGGFHPYDPKLSLAASTALLIPYYYISVYLEFGSIQKHLDEVDRVDVKMAVLSMNRMTYLILAVASLALIFTS